MTVAWKVKGIRDTTTSTFRTSASNALLSVTSNEMAFVNLIPWQSFLAFSKVRQAGMALALFLMLLVL